MSRPRFDSDAQHIWRNYRNILYNKLDIKSKQKKITFIPCKRVFNFDLESDSDIIVSSNLYDLIPNQEWFNELDNRLQQKGKALYFFTDNIVGNSYQFPSIKIFSIPKILGITANYGDVDLSAKREQKYFNCFIQRTDSVRQTWFYFLYEKKLLNRGYVSFLLFQFDDFSKLTDKELFAWIHNEYNLGELPHFQNAYNNLKHQVPFRNFEENNDLVDYILSSKYSLNLETYANQDNDCWCFTEKTLRSLQLPTIDLMFLQTGGYKVLKNLGFELLDHSYIDCLPWQQRQQKLLEILENDSVDYDRKSLVEKALYNQQLMSKWQKEILADNFFDEYFETINV